MSKHTPGPWHFFEGGKRASVYADSGHVAFCSQRKTAPNPGQRIVLADEMRANARLIAASPELLDALADADAFIASLAAEMHLDEHFPWDRRCEYGGGVTDPSWKSIDEMRQAIGIAITKATGDA